ncbi:histidine phosphatase superfamily, partial [Pavlovales sp. CCMP2436]
MALGQARTTAARRGVRLGLLLGACRAVSSAAAGPPPTRTVYLVRHAESRWNAAWRRLNVAAMLRETDHGLTVVGVDQAGTLAGVLLAEPIALGSPGAIITSSPLCRALQTAAVALCAAGARGSALVVLPDARESGGRLGFGRDSAGTPTDEVERNLAAELRGTGADAAATALRRGELTLDLSRLRHTQHWWLPLETAAEKRARLRRLLDELFRLTAAGEDGTSPRVVVVSHSYVLRDLLRDHVDEGAPFAASELRAALARRTVPNCAVFALDLAPMASCANADGAATHIVGGRLLAGAAGKFPA